MRLELSILYTIAMGDHLPGYAEAGLQDLEPRSCTSDSQMQHLLRTNGVSRTCDAILFLKRRSFIRSVPSSRIVFI